MNRMRGAAAGLGVAVLMVTGLACGNGAEPRPTETNAASDAKQAEDQLTTTLEIDGYGYTVGDVVQIETGRPALDKVIIYDPFKNKSMCLSMGPDMSLGKIVGVPGETFSFQNSGLKIRSETIRFDKDYSHLRAVFGGQKYSTLAEKTITLKDGEYLMDKRVGLECFASHLGNEPPGAASRLQHTIARGQSIPLLHGLQEIALHSGAGVEDNIVIMRRVVPIDALKACHACSGAHSPSYNSW